MNKLAFLFVMLAHLSWAQASELVPFSLPWKGAPEGIADLRSTLDMPAGKHGHVRIEEGRYVVGSEPTRFYGVNVGAAACFPPLELAPVIADRLARCGFNVVRFHHMDNNWSEGLLQYLPGEPASINPEKLDRLDRFVAELKAVGIYSNINLLCARPFRSADGLAPGVDRMDWKSTHVLGFFDDAARTLQKEFALKFLQHVNPYTGLTYAEDPAVAFVEINNENGLVHQWFSGTLDVLPPHYTRILAARWNAWLKEKYASSETLVAAWKIQQEPLGAEMLDSSGLMGNPGNWVLETHSTAVASRSAISYDSSTQGVRLTINRISGQGWHVQFNHPGLAVQANRPYTVSFWARGDRARSLPLSVMQAHEPWANLGFEAQLQLSPSWTHHTFTFSLNADDANARLNFGNLGSSTGWVEIAGITLRPGGTLGGLQEGESLEQNNLSIVRKSKPAGVEAKRDWFSFLRDIETDYWTDMESFVRQVGYQGLTWGTTIMNSSPHMQSVFASTDSHAYWQHPAFHGSDWDPVNWTVNNVSMVNDRNGGVISELAWQRVKGKPHNVTEYQHPSPNTFSSEGPLFVSAYGAFQDWDGIYYFHYGSSDTDWDRPTFNGFFDIDRHPTKLANAILGSLLFRKGLIRVGEASYVAPFDPVMELEVMLGHGGAWNVADGRHLALPKTLPLVQRFALDIEPVAELPEHPIPSAVPAPWYSDQILSDTGEILWDHSLPERSAVLLNSAKVRGVWGYQSGRSWELGAVNIQCGNTRQDWASVVMVIVEGLGFDQLDSGARGLIVTTGDIENTRMGWTDSKKESVGSQWGTGPALVEMIPATIRLSLEQKRLRVWALSPSGVRAREIPVESSETGAVLRLGGEHGSMWYEFEVAPRQ